MTSEQPQMSASIMETQTNKVFYCLLDLSSGFNLILSTTYIFLLLHKLQEFTYLIKTLTEGLYFARNAGENRGFLQRPRAAQVQFNDSVVRSEFTGQNKGQRPRISPGEADNRETGLKSFKKT